MDRNIERVLISEEEIQLRLDSLALEILERSGDGPLTIVAILKGAVVLVADLFRRMPVELTLEFITASSYHGGLESSGVVDIIGGLPDVTGARVLLVDDILDTGRTLASVKLQLEEAGAASVSTCVLLSKVKERSAEVEADFWGFEIGDEFVVGYGLDFNGIFRNLPYIGIYSETA